MGNCNGGSRAEMVGGSTSITFTTEKRDALSDKVDNAYNIKMSKSTITLKDSNDKTIGMIRGITRFEDMRFADQVEVNKYIKKAGGKANGIQLKDIFVHDKKMYVLNNKYTQRLQKNKEKNKTLKTWEDAGFIVVNYDNR